MEPGSALATAIVAAAAILPSTNPLIEVRFRDWENKTQNKVECCLIKKASPGQVILERPSIAQFAPGAKKVDKIIYSQQDGNFFSVLRVFTPLDFNNFFNVTLLYYTSQQAFQIGCVHNQVQAGEHRLTTLLDERISWDRDNPPKYILIEIDGTIVQEDLLNTSFKVEHEMFRLEKIV